MLHGATSVQYRMAIVITPEVRVHAFHCSCAAGASGACKHGMAALFRLWDLEQQGCDTVPKDLAVTELPAYWMERSGSAGEEKNAVVSWDDMVFVKHKKLNSDADFGHQGYVKGMAAALHRKRRAYQPLPVELSSVSSANVSGLCSDLKKANQSKGVTDILDSNHCQSTHYRVDAVVFHDHPFTIPYNSHLHVLVLCRWAKFSSSPYLIRLSRYESRCTCARRLQIILKLII